ncbi:MAG: DMT family transporter [Clostridiales bacterium]|nr:DMT family transporter [Clostridiales bacterium]
MSRKKVYTLMLIATWFWSGAFIAGKYCAPYIPPFTLVFLRFLIASAVLWPALKLFPIEEKYRLKKSDMRFLVNTSVIGMFGYHVLFFASLHYTTAINASIIAAVNPVLTAVFCAVLLKQFVNKQMLGGILLSLAGVLMTITGMNLDVVASLSFNRGDIFMIAAVALWCLYITVSRKRTMPPIHFTFYNFVITAILTFPLALSENPLSWMLGAGAAAWLAVAYMAVCPSVFSYCVMQVGIKELGSQRTAVFYNFVPAFSMLLAVLILGEAFELIKVITMLFIVAGVVICQTAGERMEKSRK